MNPSPDKIRSEVESARHKLAADLNALEHRVKTVTDWRWQFRQRPWPVLGIAFAGGVLLGLLVTTPSED